MAKAKTLSKCSTGKRKEAIVRVNLKAGKGSFTVNSKDYKLYFGHIERVEKKLLSPFEITGTLNQFDTFANARGGGIAGQADALMYAIAKALIAENPEHRKALKAAGLVARDARIKERKKYGQPGARKKYQFSKR